MYSENTYFGSKSYVCYIQNWNSLKCLKEKKWTFSLDIIFI